jgi:hypothetical protein
MHGLNRVAVELGLPPLLRKVMALGRKASSLAAMLPIAAEAATDRIVRDGGEFPLSLDLVVGIPLCAIDMFSECGRGALREFYASSDELLPGVNYLELSATTIVSGAVGR